MIQINTNLRGAHPQNRCEQPRAREVECRGGQHGGRRHARGRKGPIMEEKNNNITQKMMIIVVLNQMISQKKQYLGEINLKERSHNKGEVKTVSKKLKLTSLILMVH